MSGSEIRLQGLAPVVNYSCTTLILGSMPGELSLIKQQYYAHPRNHFWRLLYALLDDGKAPSGDYEQRLAFALDHRIALWDVLAACERKGSLDTHIRYPEANDFADFFRVYPAVDRVFFNGRTADRLYHRYVVPQLRQEGLDTTIRYGVLPSSSPAHTVAWEMKLAMWRVIQS